MGDVLNFICARQRRSEIPVRWTGISSDALVLYGVGRGPRPSVPDDEGRGGESYPYDEADLLACTVSYLHAPKRIRARMLPVLEEFQAWVWYGPRGSRSAGSVEGAAP